ncbi:MAG: Murein DD-endopeptidase MepM [Pelotomaculum sp. PtaB.Bin104]|nr:MAG: Murein DD-endopeptidase MepM [Pelotomaculum sp. PtaB.Bin104]
MRGIDYKPGGSFKQDDWISRYQPPHWKKPRSQGGRRRNLPRLVIAFLIFMALVTLKETQNPWGVEARETLKSVLTSEWNYQPAVDKLVQFGSQIAHTDWPLTGPVRPVVNPQVNGAAGALPVPVSGKVIQGHGMVIDPVDGMERFHNGIDIAAPVGSPVKAVLDGKVKKLGDSQTLGKYVLLEHGQGSFTLYGGLARYTVTDAQSIKAGSTIGEVGITGDIPGGVLYFELRENNKLVDPVARLQPLNAN